MIKLRSEDSQNKVWYGPRPDIKNERATNFGKLIITWDDNIIYTAIRWLDEEDELQHSSLSRRIVGTLSKLSSGSATDEQRKILEDLNEIATLILTSSKDFADPVVIKQKNNPPEQPPPVKLVDPHELVKSLDLLEESHHASTGLRSGPVP